MAEQCVTIVIRERAGQVFAYGAVVAAFGSRLVAAGGAPSPADLRADSSLPIDVVTR